MTYRLRPPTENVVPPFLPASTPAQKALMRHYGPTARGIALLVHGAAVTESRNPTTAGVRQLVVGLVNRRRGSMSPRDGDCPTSRPTDGPR